MPSCSYFPTCFPDSSLSRSVSFDRSTYVVHGTPDNAHNATSAGPACQSLSIRSGTKVSLTAAIKIPQSKNTPVDAAASSRNSRFPTNRVSKRGSSPARTIQTRASDTDTPHQAFFHGNCPCMGRLGSGGQVLLAGSSMHGRRGISNSLHASGGAREVWQAGMWARSSRAASA